MRNGNGSKGKTSTYSSLERALITVLGGMKWMTPQSSVVTEFSPNNVQLIAITSDTVIVRRHVAPPHEDKVVYKKFDPNDAPRVYGALNKILSQRRMSALEELIIDEAYFTNYFDFEQFKIDYLREMNVERLRCVSCIRGIYTYDLLDYCKKKNNLRYCISEFLYSKYGDDMVRIVYKTSIPYSFAKRYHLDATHYSMDKKDGLLDVEFKNLQGALTQLNIITKCKQILRNDIENYEYYEELRPLMTKSVVTVMQDVVKKALKTASNEVPKYDKVPSKFVERALKEMNKTDHDLFDVIDNGKGTGASKLWNTLKMWNALGNGEKYVSMKVLKSNRIPGNSGFINIKGIMTMALKNIRETLTKQYPKYLKEFDAIVCGINLEALSNKIVLEQISFSELITCLLRCYNIESEELAKTKGRQDGVVSADKEEAVKTDDDIPTPLEIEIARMKLEIMLLESGIMTCEQTIKLTGDPDWAQKQADAVKIRLKEVMEHGLPDDFQA